MELQLRLNVVDVDQPSSAGTTLTDSCHEQPDPATVKADLTRILILEDDDGDALLVKRALKSCNACFEIQHVSTLAAALPLLHSTAYDLLLLDLSLPDSFGLEGIDRLREHSPITPIVVLTGLDDNASALQALERGAQDYLIKGEWTQEGLSRTLRYAIQRHQALAENQRLLEKIRHQARFDALTGVLNRHSIAAELEREWARATRSQKPLSVVMIDVDFFKSVNDVYGHSAGDQVLRLISSWIQSQCREGDLVGRYGGEEFCAMLPETAECGAIVWAERVRAFIEKQSISLPNSCIRVTASFGVAQRRADVKSSSQLVDIADHGLLVAKRSGRNRVVSQFQVDSMRNPQRAQFFDEISQIKAEKIMQPLTSWLSADATLLEAARFMVRTGMDTAPLVDSQGNLVGVIHEANLIREWSSPRGWQAPVASAMNQHPACLPIDSTAGAVLELLQRNSLREVLLVHNSQAVGFVSRINFLNYLQQIEQATCSGPSATSHHELNPEVGCSTLPC